MALSVYSDLQSAVADWISRTDITTSQLDNMVLLFESYINRTLRTRQMETSTNLTTSSGSVALPTDYISYREFIWSSDGTALTYINPVAFQGRFPLGDAGVPRVFTINGANFVVHPVDDTTDGFSLHYYAKITSLVGNATNTNWLLTAYPDAYLFGTLVEVNAFLIDGQAAALWKQRRDEVINEITRVSNLSKTGTAVPGGWIV